jgi:hypothetical protein
MSLTIRAFNGNTGRNIPGKLREEDREGKGQVDGGKQE